MTGSDRMSKETEIKRQGEWPAEIDRGHGGAMRRPGRHEVDRWVDEQIFEEDLRAVLQMIRPHRRERMLGWSEHRTGGGDFRVTVSWDDAKFVDGSGPCRSLRQIESNLNVPRMSDVISALLLGSVRAEADISAEEECDAYLAVLGEVARRIEDLRGTFA